MRESRRDPGGIPIGIVWDPAGTKVRDLTWDPGWDPGISRPGIPAYPDWKSRQNPYKSRSGSRRDKSMGFPVGIHISRLGIPSYPNRESQQITFKQTFKFVALSIAEILLNQSVDRQKDRHHKSIDHDCLSNLANYWIISRDTCSWPEKTDPSLSRAINEFNSNFYRFA